MKQEKDFQKDQKQTGDFSSNTGLGLAVGLSLGTLFGVVFDNIGLGRMMGAALGLCGGPAMELLHGGRKSKKPQEREDDREQQ